MATIHKIPTQTVGTAREIWRKSRHLLEVFNILRQPPSSKPRNDSKLESTDTGRIKSKGRANLLARASNLPPDNSRVRFGQHLFRLRNYISATRILDPLEPKQLKGPDLFLLARVKLAADKGVEADELLIWFLQQSHAANLSLRHRFGLADWIYHAGTSADIKLERLAKLHDDITEESELASRLRRHIRYHEFRTKLSANEIPEIFTYAELDQLDLDAPEHQLRFVPHLNAMGYSVEVEHLLTQLLNHHGVEHPGVISAALRYDPEWPGLDIRYLPKSYYTRYDILQLAYDNSSVNYDYEWLFTTAIESTMQQYPGADIYTKDAILRKLLPFDLIDKMERLISVDNDLPDTVLPAHNARGLRHFMNDNFHVAKECFMRVLQEDPSDSVASQGMRLALPRTGGDMTTILGLRDGIGYGISNHGQLGHRSNIGSEKTISLLMSGKYVEGLYSKRHAAHWQILKGVYGNKFLNFETISFLESRSKSLFIIGDEGVGDEVRTAQFYPFLAKHFNNLTVSCDPRLQTIFSRSFPSIRFIAVQRYRKGLVEPIDKTQRRISGLNLKLSQYLTEDCREPMDGSDFITFGQSLFFNHFNGTIPRPTGGGYLINTCRAFPDKTTETRKLRIGILWRSHMQTMWRKFMYLKIEDFMPLLKIHGVEFWSIQHAINEHEEKFCNENGIQLIDGVDLFNDFEALGSYLSELDLVIGISSLPIELAAALGTPVWMLGFSPENYYLRTAGGRTEDDQLTLNSKIVAPTWIDFTASTRSCIDLVMSEARDRLDIMSRKRLARLRSTEP